MTPLTTRPCGFDHSYELPLRRNLLLLLDLLDFLRFIAGVLLDRVGVAQCHVDVLLPGGQAYWGAELVDAAAAERILETALRAHSSPGISSRAPWYRRRRAYRSGAAEEEEAVCAICLAGLDAGGGACQVAELCCCSHAFHAACIDAWVSGGGEAATCPLCRAPVGTGRGAESVRAAPGRPADVDLSFLHQRCNG